MLFNNIIFIPIIYFFIQLILFRFLNININKIQTLIIIFTISIFIYLETLSYQILLNLITVNLVATCFYILMPGLLNNGPGFLIIKIINKHKTKQASSIKKLFIKQMKFHEIENRLEANIKSKFIIKNKKRLNLSNRGKLLIYCFDKIVKIFNLKPHI
jgi:hypothetical protein